ncbi:MAG TPA: flagellar hook-length control protein FliK [Symbiobacteriaceae bacterium]|nr:flagellar hook-length control protein FliK [Symbiobacteriaceae bacterium]
MQPTGINPGLVRFLAATAPDLLTELLVPGKVLEAEVVSVFQERAVLSFGRGVRLEVALQTPLQEGQRVRVQVQPQPPRQAAPAPAQPQVQPPLPSQPPVRSTPGSPPGALPQVVAPPAEQPALSRPAQSGVQTANPQPNLPATAQPVSPGPQPPTAAPHAQSAGHQALQPLPQTAPQQLTSGQPAPAPRQAAPAAGQQAVPAAQPGGQVSHSTPPEPGRLQAAPAPAAAPIILKVLGPAPPREGVLPAGPLQPGQGPLEAQSAPAPARVATGAPTLGEVTAAAVQGQPQPASAVNQPGVQQTALPQVLWLPIPLPDGNQGWAQIHVQEDDSPKTRAQKGGPVQQIRIWWETPALGPVQVTLEAAAANLAALFTAAEPGSKGALEQSLPALQRRLAQVGFPEARVGCRAAAPGEAVEPARIEGANRLDKRM